MQTPPPWQVQSFRTTAKSVGKISLELIEAYSLVSWHEIISGWWMQISSWIWRALPRKLFTLIDTTLRSWDVRWRALLLVCSLDGVLAEVGQNWPASSAVGSASNELLIDTLLSDQNDDENDGKPQDGQIHVQVEPLSLRTCAKTSHYSNYAPSNRNCRNKLHDHIV